MANYHCATTCVCDATSVRYNEGRLLDRARRGWYCVTSEVDSVDRVDNMQATGDHWAVFGCLALCVTLQ